VLIQHNTGLNITFLEEGFKITNKDNHISRQILNELDLLIKDSNSLNSDQLITSLKDIYLIYSERIKDTSNHKISLGDITSSLDYKENLYQKAIDSWGYLAQLNMIIEELSELTKSISKIIRLSVSNYANPEVGLRSHSLNDGRNIGRKYTLKLKERVDKIAEETADVLTMIKQLFIMYPELKSKVRDEITQKQTILTKILDEKQNGN
jgi:NTP pyrophosphatase (non-canonical NTP hydrolase)